MQGRQLPSTALILGVRQSISCWRSFLGDSACLDSEAALPWLALLAYSATSLHDLHQIFLHACSVLDSPSPSSRCRFCPACASPPAAPCALDRSSLPAILLKSRYPMLTLRTRPLSLFLTSLLAHSRATSYCCRLRKGDFPCICVISDSRLLFPMLSLLVCGVVISSVTAV